MKNQPVLTARYCNELEALRLGVEVLRGEYVKIIDIDFNSAHAHLRVGKETKEVIFSRPSKPLLLVHFLDGKGGSTQSGIIPFPRDFIAFDYDDGFIASVSGAWVGYSLAERTAIPFTNDDLLKYVKRLNYR